MYGIVYNFTDSEKLKKLEKDFVHVSETLSGLHMDYHYGDETIVGKYGKVYKDKFIIGQCGYKVVVIPSM